MKNKDLGFDINKMLVMKGPRITDSLFVKNYEAFKTEMLRIQGVKSVSASSNIPGEENYWTRSLRRLSGGPGGTNVVTNMAIDYEFIPQYEIELVAGRNFDIQFPNDRKAIIINESLTKEIEFRDPRQAVGEKVIMGRDTLQIIGVVEDFHQMSLKSEIIPLVIRLGNAASFFSIKLEASNSKNVVEAMEIPWRSFFPENPTDYFFLDMFYNRQYERDDRFGQVFTLFTALAIFIASLGLLGLASFMALQRTREIGIRKVLGSSISGIIVLLSKGFMKPVVAAIIVACPLGWLLMDKWLQSFPYRTSINLWVFAASGLLVLAIAFFSVASQTLKAALTKPAETLKYE
jgi:putative ABC transport system permease protein